MKPLLTLLLSLLTLTGLRAANPAFNDLAWTNSAGVIRPSGTNGFYIYPFGFFVGTNTPAWWGPPSGVELLIVRSDASLGDAGLIDTYISASADGILEGTYQNRVTEDGGYVRITGTNKYFSVDISSSMASLILSNGVQDFVAFRPHSFTPTSPAFNFQAGVIPATGTELLFQVGYLNTNRLQMSGNGNLTITGLQANVTLLSPNNGSLFASGTGAFTNGVASLSVLATNAVGTTGYTNNQTVNQTAYVTATAVAFTIKDRSQATLYVSPVMTATMPVNLQPGWSITAASGLVGTVLPW